jgi:hypothetical protein
MGCIEAGYTSKSKITHRDVLSLSKDTLNLGLQDFIRVILPGIQSRLTLSQAEIVQSAAEVDNVDCMTL